MEEVYDKSDNIIPGGNFENIDIKNTEKKLVDKLSSEELYVIKNLTDGKIEDAYEGTLDFSTPEGKAEFNVLKKLISKNNWLVIPEVLFQEYEIGRVSLENLEQATIKNHEKLNLAQPVFAAMIKTKVKNDFISDINDIKASEEIASLTSTNSQNKTGISSGEAVQSKPSDILSAFQISVKHKLNELAYHKSSVQKNKGISVKTLFIAGGTFAIGVVFSPLAVITTSAAIGIGGYAILKSMFGKNSDMNNYDKQIAILKEATATMVLKKSGEDTKENIRSFVKNNTSLSQTLFDDKIEAEFARICKVRNVKIDTKIFNKAYLYDNGHVIDYNREAQQKKPKM